MYLKDYSKKKVLFSGPLMAIRPCACLRLDQETSELTLSI